MNQKLILFACILWLTGCSFDKETDSSDDQIMDLNSDGTKDVFYEYDSSGYHELVDRNFDGKVDESHRYDGKNKLVSSKIDDDLDGFLETKIIYKYESPEKVAVDTDNDNLYEIFYFYESGTLVNAIKYYQTDDGNKIGKIDFKFGYPTGEESVEITDMDESAFQKLGKLEN